MAKSDALNHERRPRSDDGKLQACSVIRCSTCNAEDLFWVGFKYSDNIAWNRFQAMGWRLDRKSATCPDCIKAKTEKDRAENIARAGEKRAARFAAPLVQLGQQIEGVKTVMNASANNGAKVVDIKTGGGPEIVDGGILRELSREQKANVRRKLDEFFDDSKGMYLDGMSDQEIARACNVPSANVAQIRVSAYGPLRQPSIAPDLQSIVQTIDAVLADCVKKSTALSAAMQAQISAVQSCAANLAHVAKSMQAEAAQHDTWFGDVTARLMTIKKSADAAIKTVGTV